MKKLKLKLAYKLVAIANNLVNHPDLPNHQPLFRPVDQHIDGIGTEHSCGAYSYEHLKSLVEQDGPDGFGATATIAWLISEDGWVSLSDMKPREIRRMFAMNGMDLDGDLEGEDV